MKKFNKKITRRNFLKKLLGGIIGICITPYFSRLFGGGKKKIFAAINVLPKVVRVYDKNAVFWGYKKGKYIDFVNQKIVDQMVEKGVCALTEEVTPAKAWKKIMKMYKFGDKVAIKPNFNNIHHGYRELFTSPQVLNSVIKGLVEYVNVPEQKIYIYDLCRPIPYENMRDRINYRVNYVELFEPKSVVDKIKLRLGTGLEFSDYSVPIKMSNKIIDRDGRSVTCYIPKVLTQAQHLINIPIFTNHVFVSASGPLKNHFGTVRFSNYDSGPSSLHGENIEQSMVDINVNNHIKNKTRLIIVDALFGMYSRGEISGIRRWKTFPCDNGIPNSLLFSKDPVAIESIMNDYIEAERKFHGFDVLSMRYMYYSMQRGLGIYEGRDENGVYRNINYIEV